MSGWADYVKNMMDNADAIKQGAIIGKTDGSLWGKLPDNFAITTDECTALSKAFTDLNGVPATGVTVAGTKYIVPRVDENLIFGKAGTKGVFATSTNQTIIVALFEGQSSEAAQARTAIESTADYLKQSNY
ncbi:profilin [Streptantibioticus ferralitis]|uniref:Profilin n=1 Tax=Streptantibioticus ferralitis TaxID=236510 RepID=A0ABT5YU91_9ACTN|nr:profilin [Streptantibioticus ferralitis]MDF2254942.1 profilin [Streptantibioticus ferralitis]